MAVCSTMKHNPVPQPQPPVNSWAPAESRGITLGHTLRHRPPQPTRTPNLNSTTTRLCYFSLPSRQEPLGESYQPRSNTDSPHQFGHCTRLSGLLLLHLRVSCMATPVSPALTPSRPSPSSSGPLSTTVLQSGAFFHNEALTANCSY